MSILPLLEISQLSKNYSSKIILNQIDLKIFAGETVGLVGESGSGKSTLGKILVNLLSPSAGTVLFKGQEISKLGRQLCKEVQIIFQDPYSSLNPRLTVEQLIGEPFDIHHLATGKLKREKIAFLLESVGLSAAYFTRYPHTLSGGQRQRITIARALALQPQFIVCDEPVSALDTVNQSLILELLIDLKKHFNVAYLFISHDLTVVKKIADRVAILYQGEIIELQPTIDLYTNPQQAYTKLLLASTFF